MNVHGKDHHVHGSLNRAPSSLHRNSLTQNTDLLYGASMIELPTKTVQGI